VGSKAGDDMGVSSQGREDRDVKRCVERMRLPFESWAMMGLLAGHILVMGAVVMRK
jgi:hypothetical protein